MTINLEINSNKILVLDKKATTKIVGNEFSDFDEMFGSQESCSGAPSNLTIDSSLIPSFNVNTIEEIANRQAESRFPNLGQLLKSYSNQYIDLIDVLIGASRVGCWTRCDLQTQVVTYHQQISEDETALIYDTETFVKEGGMPIIGQALSSSALWLWLDQSFDGITEYKPSLLPIGKSNSTRVLIAQNSAFDTCRLAERFDIANNISFIDTMSITNMLAGLSSDSRWALAVPPGTNGRADSIRRLGCGKSLVDAYNYFCVDYPPLSSASKSTRNIFVEAKDFQEFIDNKYNLLQYSLLDVIYTLRLLQAQWKALEKFSGESTMALLVGQAIISDALVPVQPDRERWIATCDELALDSFTIINSLVFDYFQDIHTAGLVGSITLDSKVDWRISKPKGWRKKSLPEGYPVMAKWWVQFLSGDLSPTTNAFGRLLELEFFVDGKWRPLMQSQKLGWHYRGKTGELIRVPHASGDLEANVGCMISSDTLRFFDGYDEPILRSKTLNYNNELLKEILELADSTSIWSGFANRIKSQITA